MTGLPGGDAVSCARHRPSGGARIAFPIINQSKKGLEAAISDIVGGVCSRR